MLSEEVAAELRKERVREAQCLELERLYLM